MKSVKLFVLYHFPTNKLFYISNDNKNENLGMGGQIWQLFQNTFRGHLNKKKVIDIVIWKWKIEPQSMSTMYNKKFTFL